ncbi:hypothetical protein IHE44_0010347 [Lamprotornis superbus]|uniref:Uncharacterized protein n=1 Tax=Lamprotornis superbus TaxID=245042 RepID=A0A835ND43_9PASS|nr:hypothetical protein IHE44_0010347 [Lamprotornis superbus]
MDPYVPPEGDARLTSLSKDGVKQQVQKLRQTAASQLANGQIVNYFNEFQGDFSWQDMVRGNRYKTIHWRFVESLEPPRVVHVRCESIMNRGNLYGQVTVRMHSRQRYLVNPYGTWRMHGKIVPDWAPPKDPIIKTVMIPGPAPDPSEEHQKMK